MTVATEPAAPVPTPADARKDGTRRLTPLERHIIDGYQRGFPLAPRPYRVIAERLGVTEADVTAALKRLSRRGVLSRIGAVVAPHRIGRSTLAALAVPRDRLDAVAAFVASFPDVNHLYEREHAFNLWFVVAAPTRARVRTVLARIAGRTGLKPLDLPLEAAYHIDLGFPIQWN